MKNVVSRWPNAGASSAVKKGMVTSDIPGHPSHAKPRKMLIFQRLNSDRHSLYKAEESYKMCIYWMYRNTSRFGKAHGGEWEMLWGPTVTSTWPW